MKYTKKILSLLLAVVMVFAMAVTVGADETKGSITIENPVDDQTYSAYKIFDVTYSGTAYSYTINSDSQWYSTVSSYNGVTLTQIGSTGVYNVAKTNSFDAATFATTLKSALTGKTATATLSKDASGAVKASGLDLGYYLIDSSLGSLCSLDTMNPNATVKEKNGAPTIEKKVKEDSSSTWGDTNDADIGQTVEFKVTIKVTDGKPESYVMHDEMSTGLSFDSTSVVVKINNVQKTAGTDYTLTAPATHDNNDKHTFDISFTKLEPNDEIEVTYSATLNESAVVAGQGNPNKVKLTYGENKYTEWDATTTYTWKGEVYKFTGSDDNKTPLAGATFTLSKKSDGTDPIKLIKTADNTYRLAKENENNSITEITTDSTGKFSISGLDGDTYYLTETKAPAGYNKLTSAITVTISSTNGEVSYTYGSDSGKGEIPVVNNTGTELPSTGGMGTTIFYILGSVLVLAAVVLLVTKKRMGSENA